MIKKLQITSAVILTITVILLLSACEISKEGDNNINMNMNINEKITYTASQENVKQLGRVLFSDGILWCAHSGTGAEFKVNAAAVHVTVIGDSERYARVAIYLDNERVIDDLTNEREKTYTIFKSETPREAVIKIVKLSESAMSVFGINGIEVEAGEKITPIAEKDVLIEFIGDSITCGYGVDDENKDHPFKIETEDFTKAFAYKTAAALGADYSIAAFSGYGVVSGYDANGRKNSASTVPRYYDKLCFTYGSAGSLNLSETEWDFDKRQPDIIVINLGTNDDSYCQDDAEKQAEFESAYYDFIGQVRGYNPDAVIICAFGIMGGRLYPYIESAVNAYTEKNGDSNVFSLRFDAQNAADGYAADWHPTEATHEKAADKLTEYINSLSTKTDIDKPVIALTFDDGPNMTTTVEVLDILEKYEINATFFVIGNNINDETAKAVKRAYDMGCEIGNHSKTHSYMNNMPAEDIKAEIEFTSDKILKITGEPAKFFRPPYIAVSDIMYEVIEMPFICGISANDWEEKYDAAYRAEKILEQAKDGVIILLHDLEGNKKTVAALDAIISGLLEQGFRFVTVSELFEVKGITPVNGGKTIYNGAW